MRRCHYCGGKLGLIVRRKWRLRFASSLARNLMSTASPSKFGIEDDGSIPRYCSQRWRLLSTAITLPENGSDIGLSPRI